MANDLPPPPAAEPGWAWFLDVDGTLVDIAPTPSSVAVPQALPDLLARLSKACGGAVALVSGRSLDNLRQLVVPYDGPAAGLHGLERRDAAGAVRRQEIPPGLDDIRARLAGAIGAVPGVLIEDKGAGVALHYRQAPEQAEVARRAAMAAVAAHPGFTLLAGKMVFEIKPEGTDKGGAVRAFMAEAPFAGRRPVFVGDDVTDEYGFQLANEMGGISVLVGPMRETAARYRQPDIGACRKWLAHAAGAEWDATMGEGAD